MENRNTCPCGSNKSYTNCCKLAHDNIHNVQSAEALMRSRYVAFVLANGDYLQKSHHTSNRPNKREVNDIIQWAKSVQWVKLEVIQSTAGLEKDAEGSVEFKAFFMEHGKPNVIHEKSRFVKEDGHWVYLDGMNAT